MDSCSGDDRATLTVAKLEDGIVGWRVWTLSEERLILSISGTSWNPGEPVRAVCMPTSGIVVRAPGRAGARPPAPVSAHEHGAVPDPACTCGIYAWDSPDERAWDETRVVGTVRLWGRIVHAERCYRAEFGYPAALWVPRSSARRRARRSALRALHAYGVPVEVAASLAQLHLVRSGRLDCDS
ncbi:MAG TPA: hypothetical protein VFZ00_13680 [Solirubrobacter sp.]|nr:hypothetical protein [Solirubrobacter sp.]